MTSRHVVLLLTLIVLLFEADVLAQRKQADDTLRRVFAIVAIPLLVGSALVVYRRWHGLR